MRHLKKSNPKLMISRFLNRLISLYNGWFRPIFPRSRCLILHNGQILLVKNFTGSGMWSLPGGGAKRGESYRQAAIREVQEELGIKLKKVNPLGVFKVPKTDYTLVAHTFWAEAPNLNFTADKWEILDAAWFDINNLPESGPLVAIAVQAYTQKHVSYPQENLAKSSITPVK